MELSLSAIAFIVIMGIWMVISVIANICIVIVVVSYKAMRSVTNVFICNIALSDTLLVAYVLPQMLHDISHAADYFEGESAAAAAASE